ncbi:MAG: response regulator [Pseudobdellovibrionaceae bacterium]
MGFKFEKLSILVVEDTLPMQKLIVSVLDTLGVGTVIQAKDGEEGYAKYLKTRPDIVMTDWLMKPSDGIELVQKIRMDPKSPNRFVPIILVTGYNALPRVREARDAGVTEFLIKPFTANDLAKRIAYVINRPRDFIESKTFFGPDRRRVMTASYKGPWRRTTDRKKTG